MISNMVISWPAIVIGVLCIKSSLAQFIPPPTDLTTVTGYAGVQVRYKEVPHGICELNNSVKSYAGYVDVAPNQHIFFWFFESRSNPLEDPLTLWMSGGPGSTSMSELMINHGPCMISKHYKPYNNPYSWTQNSNMLFVDQPVGVGFSYTIPIPAANDPDAGDVTAVLGLPSNECPDYATDNCGTFSLQDITLTANTTDAGKENIWKTLQGFMGAFPQYSKNGFNFASESYGGHYGPVYVDYILEQNRKNITNATVIDVRSLLVGNGWFDPLLQNIAFYNYSITNGNPYDINVLSKSEEAEMYNNLFGPGNCIDQTKQCYATKRADVCNQADNFCQTYVQDYWIDRSHRNEVDIRELNRDPLPHDYFYEYLTKIEVLQAIGAYTNLSDYPLSVVQAFTTTGDDSLLDGTIDELRSILANNVTVVIYAGDSDYECNWIGNLMVAEELAPDGFDNAGFVNVTTPDGVVHGQVRQSNGFSFVRIYEAGHEVPFYQPIISLNMFTRAIQGLDVATGTQSAAPGSGYRTVGPLVSSYREGNGTVQYKKLPDKAQYNTTTNKPYIPKAGSGSRRRSWRPKNLLNNKYR